MPKLLQIGELAKQTGLSIRTLRYYDQIGLLVPSHRTEAEYRLYSEADIARLQQILSLRQLGFALKEVRECLENPDFSLPNAIDLHLAQLQEQMAVSQLLFAKLSSLSRQLQTSQAVAVDDLLQIMENLTMTQQYLTQEQNDLLEARLNQEQTEWLHFLEQVRSQIAQGRDLNSPEVQQLARYWRDGIVSFVGGDLKLYEALAQTYQKEGAEAASWGTLDAPTLDYILKAVALLSVREEMVGFSLDRLTSEAREVLTRGQESMRELHLNWFGTEGLLLGLLAIETSSAAQALKNHGVDFIIAQNLFRNWLAKCTVPATKIPAEIPFTPRAYRVLELTAEQAKQQGHKQINPQDLLLGILQEGETGGGMAMRVLQECGVDCQQLKQQLSSV
ncbi:MerR family transcriptional regulator [Roseofilum casamattae]|uniref:MerR family transcriptional regulator n=1 Tax=Roseofilum casamattae BLCC-M143 TaxID=3022442 RepID=A0ABT7C1P1_9CYAN|nr:MerR family transcriptional regulator [Roseofilum casamattae]MDJ1185225.1 MerR family transcriptional regulator [Roseofilum casamattae BLCC-M143]